MNPTLFKPLSQQHPVDKAMDSIEQSLQITHYHVEQLLTLDGVPVNVEAVMCWHMPHAQEAKTSLANSQQAIGGVVQAILEGRILESTLAALLSGPAAIGAQLRQAIGEKIVRWGAVVHAVEIQGVSLPGGIDGRNDMHVVQEMNRCMSRHRLDRVAEAIRYQLDRAAQSPLATQTSALQTPSP